MMTLFNRLVAILEALPARRRSFVGLGVLSLLLLAGSSATSFAGFLPTITLGDAGPNFNPATYPPTYGTITIERTSSNSINVTIERDAGSHNGYYYLFGDGSTIALNLTGTNLTLSPGSTFQSPISGTSTFTQANSGNVDSMGNFTFIVDTSDGAADAISKLSFTVTASGSPWATDADVLSLNDSNKVAAAHLFAYQGEPSASSHNAALTAYVGDGPRLTAVPEPATIVMLATGLPVGLLALRRRFRGYPATV